MPALTITAMVGLVIASTQVIKKALPKATANWIPIATAAAVAGVAVGVKYFAPPAWIEMIQEWVTVVGLATGTSTLASKVRSKLNSIAIKG